MYTTYTLVDGSTYTTHNKGKVKATPQGVTPRDKWTGDIIHGTGGFQGIKGTITLSSKILPPEKGGAGRKVTWRRDLYLYLAEQVIR